MKNYIENFKKEKQNTANIVIFSVVLSTLINIVSGAILSFYKLPPWLYIISGIIFIVILIFFSLFLRIKKLNTKLMLKSMFIIDTKNNNNFMSIPNYKINQDMSNYLGSAFCESNAIKTVWESGNLNCFDDFHATESGKIYAQCNDSILLLIELIEYTILDNFSVFISDYFNKQHLNDKVQELTRESIPDLLLSNRFLLLFSGEMKNRDAFLEDSDSSDQQNIVYAYSKNGALYNRFEMQLPKGTKIYKDKNNTIVINTKLFILKIEYLYGGFSTVLDNEFYEYYLGKTFDTTLNTYEFNINLSVKYKWTSILKLYDWKYYNWLDEYVYKLQHYCNKNTFLNDIGWNQIKSGIQIYKNINKKNK